MFYPFPSIEQYRTVIKKVKEHTQYIGKNIDGTPIYDYTIALPILRYQGTVKLHGTNAAIIRHSDGNITYQSRSRIITPLDDNCGFAAAMSCIDKADLFKSFNTDTVVVYGEWCGRGVQSGVAVTQLPKMFVIFKIKVNNEWVDMRQYQHIELPECTIYNIYNFKTWDLTIDFNNPQDVQNELASITEEVGAECPVGKHFGISGIGEGVVWSCINEGYNHSDFVFKVKDERHTVTKVKTLAAVDVEKLNTVKDFVNSVVTENRLRQGLDYLRERGLEIDVKNTGAFLKWLYNDVIKEELDTIEASGLEESEIGKAISAEGKKWFFNILNS